MNKYKTYRIFKGGVWYKYYTFSNSKEEWKRNVYKLDDGKILLKVENYKEPLLFRFFRIISNEKFMIGFFTSCVWLIGLAFYFRTNDISLFVILTYFHCIFLYLLSKDFCD